MSVVALAGDAQSNLTLADLQQVAAQHNIAFADEAEAADYLTLLRSTDMLIQSVVDSPDYIHPALLPQEVLGPSPRKYWRPASTENPLNAWSHRCNVQAAHPTSSRLAGRTLAVKDNISIAGLPTTIGTFAELHSPDAKFPISSIDATVVSRVLEAAGCIVGTATCENYSATVMSYTSASGPVQNPWANGHTTGGSSSGCAALVAASKISSSSSGRPFGETVDMAIGGDQGGSVRIPASFTGVYGLKPTHGLIPYTGAVCTSPMVDHLGPMANSLRDIATLLQVLAGYDGLDARMTPETPLRENVKDYPGLLDAFLDQQPDKTNLGSGLRVGLLTESFNVAAMSDEVRETVLHSARTAFTAAGASVVDVSVPMHLQGPTIWTAATRASLADWACKGRVPGFLTHNTPHLSLRWPPDQQMHDLLTATNPAVMNLIFSGAMLQEQFGPEAEAKAHRKVFELRAAYDEALQEVDVLITPCTPTVAPKHPKLKTDTEKGSSVMEKMNLVMGCTSNTCPFNVTGHPAMNVPCGFSGGGELRLPIGMQVIAKRWDEETILKAAAVFEQGRKLSE